MDNECIYNVLVYDDVDYDNLMKTLFDKLNDKYTTIGIDSYSYRGDDDGIAKMQDISLSKLKEYIDNGYHIEHLKMKEENNFIVYERGVAKPYDEMSIGSIAISKNELDYLDEILKDIDNDLNLINKCIREVGFHRIVVKDTASDEVYDEYIAYIEGGGDKFKVIKV